MAQVDLKDLTRGEVRMLTGQPRGFNARKHYHMDDLDLSDEPVTIVAPEDLDTVTPSFVQGFLATSLRSLGEEKFRTKFNFDRLPSLLQDDFRLGIERVVWLGTSGRSKKFPPAKR
ncbi:hypothetical protein [Acidimangrovimonas sediminis]|uniref:hypothetical protein n=1 Tax=Acidimangrovimonas sediminis TaxID=2056283 RepID=UPI0011AF0E64|nr:hypothetical protein [Acidimangrovimonas sediminis]